jgi:phenylpropionate dioxygenase-like ring-hydroxylating dioxygenase large terminal subunit
LLELHCSHRGADLSYGRIEDGGLRCIYHGWLYDIQGRCLDQPGEPGGGAHRDSIRHPAYPCVEKAGIIFAYLGPGGSQDSRLQAGAEQKESLSPGPKIDAEGELQRDRL